MSPNLQSGNAETPHGKQVLCAFQDGSIAKIVAQLPVCVRHLMLGHRFLSESSISSMPRSVPLQGENNIPWSSSLHPLNSYPDSPGRKQELPGQPVLEPPLSLYLDHVPDHMLNG